MGLMLDFYSLTRGLKLEIKALNSISHILLSWVPNLVRLSSLYLCSGILIYIGILHTALSNRLSSSKLKSLSAFISLKCQTHTLLSLQTPVNQKIEKVRW